jgi:hypothetical protein
VEELAWQFKVPGSLESLWRVTQCGEILRSVGDKLSLWGVPIMVEGFWIVQYEGIQGNGGGVVVFMKGRVLGGDTGFIYTGSYKTDEQTISAQVSVRNFLPEVPNVLGVQGDLELALQGTVAAQVIRASASLANGGGAGLVLKLTKVSDLPA